MSRVFEGIFAVIHLGGIAALVALWLLPRWRDWFERRCVGPARAEDLAHVRAVACLALGVYVLSENLASLARLDTAFYAPPGYLRLFGHAAFDWFLESAWRLRGMTFAVLVALALAGAGVFPRVTLPLAAVLYFAFAALARAHGKLFHEGYLAWYVLIVLACVHLGRRPRVDEGDGKVAYPWMVWACQAAAVVPYLQLSLTKLWIGGLFWFDGRSIRNYALIDNLNVAQWEIDGALHLYQAPTLLFTLSGLFGLCTETLYPLVLVVPRLRLLLPAAVILMHFGIFLLQDFPFVDAMLLPLIFFTPSRLRGRAA
jgi:hypothetical protein